MYMILYCVQYFIVSVDLNGYFTFMVSCYYSVLVKGYARPKLFCHNIAVRCNYFFNAEKNFVSFSRYLNFFIFHESANFKILTSS